MPPKTAVISIGDELLSGRTLNTNILFLGRELGKIGLPIHFAPTTRDKKELLEETLRFCLENYELVITTGGLGPTSDDVTKQIVADYFGVPLIIHEPTWERIQKRFPRRYIPEINRRQAEIPQGFTILENGMGSAPGLYFKVPPTDENAAQDNKNEKLLILLPGVPYEMEHIFNERVVPLLKRIYRLPSLSVKTLHTIDVPESTLAEMISDIPVPPEVDLAYLPQPGRVDIRLIGANHQDVDKVYEQIFERVKGHVWGIDDDSLPLKVHQMLIDKKLSLAIAESCTGGMVQQMLTALPDASKYLFGGVVSYSNEAKIDVLGVNRDTIEKYGAVSIQTASEMAQRVRRLFSSDIGISITGIAGPSGGTEDKPVGTVCFGLNCDNKTDTFRKLFTGNRRLIREKSADYLLYLLIQAFGTAK